MTQLDRRNFLFRAGASGAALHPAIARALTIDAKVRTGTIADVEHVVIFMQENRSFDHYFGSMPGVRGFADRFPIPVPDTPEREAATVWTQANTPKEGGPGLIAPFPLDTVQSFALMRVEGTPHAWPDAQGAWDEGRMDRWPAFKTEHSMGYFRKADIPFQFALADAFTLCDAYHCSIQSSTNPNRLFLWTGTNDPTGRAGGPVLANSHDRFPAAGVVQEPYRWTSYVERLQAKGVTWRIYEDMADNAADNPLVGFEAFRNAYAKVPGADLRLAQEGLSTHTLADLRRDVIDGVLPQVSYIVAPFAACEHPIHSSPAQGADYTATVLDALTANPKVWAKTVLLVMFDENDGFFDHVPPPAPPSRNADGTPNGASTVATDDDLHLVPSAADRTSERPELMGRPYGLGPRVPMFVISPWSRGGWVNSEVFDHTSVIRFLEARFGVAEPNISPWRRAVCGDLTSAFNFKSPNREAAPPRLPATREIAARAAALPGRTRPPTPRGLIAPTQAAGVRPSRALPYDLEASLEIDSGAARIAFVNSGAAGAVFHVYDRRNLDRGPRRYTVEAGKRLDGLWDAAAYDLWVLGPNGFHRHFRGVAETGLIVRAAGDRARGRLSLILHNPGPEAVAATVAAGAYVKALAPWSVRLAPGATAEHAWRLERTGGWYDLSVATTAHPDWLRRLAGRLETGRDSVSDPEMAGPALMTLTS